MKPPEFWVEVKHIKVDSSRGRKKLEKIDTLSENIKKLGLIHPLAVTNIGVNEYLLIAGERRLRACMLLGMSKVRCTLHSDLDDVSIKEMELEENLQREELEWPEKIELLRQLDVLKRESEGSAAPGKLGKNTGWTVEKTAAVTGMSSGNVSQQLKLAKTLADRPDIKDKVKRMPLHTAIKRVEQLLKTEDIKRQQDQGLLKVNTSIRHGDARQLIKDVKSESVDVIITDPPFGSSTIENDRQHGRENYAKASGKHVAAYSAGLVASDNATVEEVTRLMFELMPEFQRVLKPSGHIYIFFSFETYTHLLNTMKAFFEVNDTPIIWYKNRTTSPGMGYEYSPCYEPVLFGHKEPRKKKLKKDAALLQNVKPLMARQKSHPFEKPQELLKFFIRQSSYKGDTVLDPFVGSGATVIAARALGRTGLGFELDKGHFEDAQRRLVE